MSVDPVIVNLILGRYFSWGYTSFANLCFSIFLRSLSIFIRSLWSSVNYPVFDATATAFFCPLNLTNLCRILKSLLAVAVINCSIWLAYSSVLHLSLFGVPSLDLLPFFYLWPDCKGSLLSSSTPPSFEKGQVAAVSLPMRFCYATILD